MPAKLLVVDDDPMIHRMLKHAFKDDDHAQINFTNGEQALEWMSSNFLEVDCIVLDWEMPGMTGLQLLQQLKKEDHYKDIPVVMLTSHSAKSHIQKGIEAGAYYYVTKPFNKEFLRSIVNRAIHDYLQIKKLKNHLRESQNPFSNMLHGCFTLRTFDESQRLSVMIANASRSPDKSLLICELFINAVEHGNLGIGYEEKTKLIEENRLMQEISERLEHPDFSSKYAMVNINRENGNLIVRVKDEGKGFDYKRFLEFDESRIFDNHGRGIAMANTMLTIKYLGIGNEVEVKIPMLN